jgi:putative transposase
MKRRKHPQADRAQVAGSGPVADRGQDVPEVAKHLEVSEATYHRWRAQYGGLKADHVRRSRSWTPRALGGRGSRPTRSCRLRP